MTDQQYTPAFDSESFNNDLQYTRDRHGRRPPTSMKLAIFIRALDAETLKDELLADTRAVFKLDHAEVFGDLSLKYGRVKRPIEIQHCHFWDKVDLRYCEFEDAVTFSYCIFDSIFNSGYVIESRTIYKKDLIFNYVNFKNTVSFNGAKIEGSAYFKRAKFQYATDQNIDGTVKYTPDDNASSVPGCRPQYSMEADFTGVQCRFLECNDATFKGGVSFNHVQCQTAFFEGAQFEHPYKAVDFRASKFEGNFQAERAKFEGPLDFRGVHCERKALFNGATFALKANFTDARLGWLLDCSGAHFCGPVTFRRATCTGDATFKDAEFAYCSKAQISGDDAEVDFRYASFDYDLGFENVSCNRPVDLGQIRVSQKLVLHDAEFTDVVKLYGADIGTLVLRSRDSSKEADKVNSVDQESLLFPFKMMESLDLTGCCFKRFHGGPDREFEWSMACDFAGAQDPKRFSRDPYLQLEKYYRDQSDQKRADEIHINGHKQLRANARNKNGSTHWSWEQWVKDSLLFWLTGWGLKMGRVLGASLVIIIGGILVFTFVEPNALKPVKEGTSVPSFWESVLYSIDLFLPFSLGFDERWLPASGNAPFYAALLTVLGWLLVPLGVAAITGIINKND